MKLAMPQTAPPTPTPRQRPRPKTSKDLVLSIAVGAAAGALSAFLLASLGVHAVVNLSTPATVLIATLVGAIVGVLKWQRFLVYVACVLLIVFIVIAYTPVMYGVASSWVRDDPIPPSADAIVVLSASVKSDGALNAEGTERLLEGIELFQRRIAPRVFTTSVEAMYPNGVRVSNADQKRLLKMGGADSAWTSLSGAFTTRDEALQSAIQLPAASRKVVVVTSPLHTRRACATFEAVGFTVICHPATERQYVTWHPLSPPDRLASFRDYLYERMGVLKYRSKGWVK